MLSNLGKLCHVLPLANQVVGFFIYEKSSTVEIWFCNEKQSLFEVKSLIEDLLWEGILKPFVSDSENFSPVFIFAQHGTDQDLTLLDG